MTTTMALTINTKFSLQTHGGGRCRYQVEELAPLELLLTVFLFLVSVVIQAVKIEASARPIVGRLPAAPVVATPRRVAAVWAGQWLAGVSELVRSWFGGGLS